MSRREHSLDITRNQVDLQVHLAAGPQVLQGGDLYRVRDQVDRERAAAGGVFHPVHRQRHAVDHDRALVGQVFAQFARRFHHQLP